MAVNLHLHVSIQNPKIVQPNINLLLFFQKHDFIVQRTVSFEFSVGTIDHTNCVPTNLITLESFPHPLKIFENTWLMSLSRQDFAV